MRDILIPKPRRRLHCSGCGAPGKINFCPNCKDKPKVTGPIPTYPATERVRGYRQHRCSGCRRPGRIDQCLYCNPGKVAAVRTSAKAILEPPQEPLEPRAVVYVPLTGLDRPLCSDCGESTQRRAVFQYATERKLCSRCAVAIATGAVLL